MTPTIKQRLGLAPVRLAHAEHERLTAARAAAVLYLVVATLALAALAAGAGVETALRVVLPAAVAAYAFAIGILLRYERTPMAARQILAALSSTMIAAIVVALPNGAPFAALCTLFVLYVSFFYSRLQAVIQTAWVVTALGAAFFLSYPVAAAVERSILFGGVLAGMAGAVIVLRARLDGLVVTARTDRAELDAFFDNAAGGFAFLDRDLRYVRVNAPLAELIGLPVSELVGRPVHESAAADDTLEPLLRLVLETGDPLVGVEIAGADGERHYLGNYYPVGPGAEALGIGMTLTDVTRLKDAERDLEASNRRLSVLATTDELTGLPNRRMFSEQLALALARARRTNRAVALLSVDLDRFKDVNDSLGHAYGDRMLEQVARLIRSGARDTDVVARIGGDEFVVLLADLDVEEAPTAAETVIERIQELLAMPISLGPVELPARASIGVSIFPLDAADENGLLAAADEAMYERKIPSARAFAV